MPSITISASRAVVVPGKALNGPVAAGTSPGAPRESFRVLARYVAEEPMMTQAANDDRKFSVHARHAGPHHARIIHEPSFEAAAVAYVEDLAIAPDDDGEISVIVRDLDSGGEHCFRIDLDTGETAPCG
jgi:hypothetical protein